jgi:hypothetical protein
VDKPTLPNFDILRAVLKPVSKERLEEIMRERAGTGGEQLTLAGTGLVVEVRGILERRAARKATE